MDDVKSEVSSALAARAGQPAESPEQAAGQIAELRTALTRDLDALRTRIPPTDQISDQTRRVGGAVAAAGATLGIVTLVLKRRGRRRAEQEALRAQAVALARELARLELEGDDVAPDDRGGWLGKAAAVVVALTGLAAAGVTIRQRMRGDDELWDAPA